MAISWLMKQRIRFDYKLLRRMNPEKVTDEMIDYAFSLPNFDPGDLVGRFSSNEHFIDKLLESDFPNKGTNLISILRSDNKPSETSIQKIVDKIIEENYPFYFYEVTNEIKASHPELVTHYIRTHPEEKYIYMDRDFEKFATNYTEEQVRGIVDAFFEVKSYDDMPEYFLSDPKFAKAVLSKDLGEIIKEFTGDRYLRSSESLANVKNYFLENIDENIQSYFDFKKLFKYERTPMFTPEEQEIVLNAARNGNFTFKGRPDPFLLDGDVIINAIENSSTQEEFDMVSFKDFRSNVRGGFTPEQEERLAQAIAKKISVSTSTEMDNMVKELGNIYSDVITRITEINPYAMDYLRKVYGYDSAYLSEKLKDLPEGKYLPSIYTPLAFFEKKPELFLKYLSRHFEEATDRERFPGTMPELPDTEEMYRRVYDIALENGYVLTDKSPIYLKTNPYLYFDAVQRGTITRDPRIEDTWRLSAKALLREQFDSLKSHGMDEKDVLDFLMSNHYYLGITDSSTKLLGLDYEHRKVIRSPEYIFRSLRENIYSALGYKERSYYPIEEMSLEDFETIANILEETDKSAIPPRVLREIENSPLFAENPYFLLRKYRAQDTMPGHGENVAFSDEMLREIADLYMQRKGRALFKYDFPLEQSNPYIIRYSIEQNPQSIDNVYINEGNEEIENLIIECLRDGRYRFSKSTNQKLFNNERILDYIIREGDLSNLQFARGIKTTEEQKRIINERILKEGEAGIISNYNLLTINTPEETGRMVDTLIKYSQTGRELGVLLRVPLPYKDIKGLCLLNPNNIKYLDYGLKQKDLVADEEFVQYLVENIRNGRIVLDKNIPRCFDTIPALREELTRDPANYLLLDSYSISEQGEKDKILEMVDNGTLEVPDSIDYKNLYRIFCYDDDEKVDKLVRYILEKRPQDIQEIYFELESSVSDELQQELTERFINSIKNGEIVVDDNFPIRTITNDDVFIEVVRRNPKLVTEANLQYHNFLRVGEKANEFLRETFGEQWYNSISLPKRNTSEIPTEQLMDDTRVLRRISTDPSQIYHINPALVIDYSDAKRFLDIALESKMVLNENSHFLFRSNKNIILQSIALDPTSVVYAMTDDAFTDQEIEDVKRALMNNNPPVLLSEKSLNFLKNDVDYIMFSLDRLSDDELAEAVGAIDFENVYKYSPDKDKLNDRIWSLVQEGRLKLSDTKNITFISKMIEDHSLVDDLLEKDLAILGHAGFDVRAFSVDEQRKIYDLYKQNEEEYSNNELVQQAMAKNSFFVSEQITLHPETIEASSYNGLQLTDEAKERVREYYLENNLEVSEKTPRFLINDEQFVYQYIMQNNGELRGLSLDDVAPLLSFAEVKKHPEFLNLANFYDQIDMGYNLYFEKWGREKTFEVAMQVGNLIRFMNPNHEPNIETLKKDFDVILQNRNNFKPEEIIEIITTLDLELPDDFFNTHKELTTSDVLFNFLIEKNPEIIHKYLGDNPNVLLKAIDNGAEITSDLLLNSNIRRSDAVFKRVLEEKPELFGLYQGKTTEVLKTAYEKGFFSNQTSQGLDEILERNPEFSRNTELFNLLLTEYGPSIGEKYNGSDDRIVNRLINEGFFDGRTDEQIVELLQSKSNFSDNDAIFSYLLDHYSPSVVEEYRGFSEEVYQKATEKGFKVDVSLFERRPELASIRKLVDIGMEQDKFCSGLIISDLAKDVNGNRDEILSIIRTIIGDEEYGQIVNNQERQEAILNLCTISDNPMVGISLLKSMNQDFIKELGFERWKQFVKYTFNNPGLKNVVGIIDSGNIKEFMDIYKSLEVYYKDEQAYGINELLKFAELYHYNPELLKALGQKTISGQVLSEEEQMDLYVVLYSSDTKLKENTTFDDIGKLTEREAARRLEKLEHSTNATIKSDLVSFLFGMNETEVGNLLKLDIDSQTLLRIINRAKKDGNKQLEANSRNLLVLVDLIEQIHYSDPYKEDITEIARNIYSQDPKTLTQIRRSFANVREKVRQFYEIEAQSELTNVQDLMKHPEFVEKDGEDIIVDLSKTRHTLYGHVLGTTVPAFFNTDKGKVTICVSPISDQHEAYYYNSTQVRLGFDSIPTGSFIGSAPTNMGSNGSISYNDYDIDRVRGSFRQTGIRESYKDSGEANAGHGETLLYRNGLVPSCVILVGDSPTDIEREARREIEAFINKGKTPEDPDYVVIPFVRTQKAQNRVFAYERELPKEMLETEVGNKQEERIDELRKLFSGIFGFKSEGLARVSTRGEQYVIQGDDVYTLIDDYTPRQIGAMKAGEALQKLVYGDESDLAMDIREFTDESSTLGKQHIGIRDVNARSLWSFNRQSQKFSHTTNSILLKEFLVDHLLVNYQVGNTSYELDIDDRIYGRNKAAAGEAIDDFIGADGSVYTSMSYLYFDSQQGNNLYRKVFENYIASKDADEVFTQDDFEEFIETAQQISKMDDEQYLEMFGEMLSSIPSEEEKERLAKVLLERKKNIGKDSREFVERIQNLREIEQEPEVIEDPNTVAFINDIHGNAEALQALLDECERTGRKDIFILGDMIGFGPQSNECLDLLRANSEKFNIRCVLGNHELYSLMGNKSFIGETVGFQPETTSQIRNTLSAENREFIESLPLTRRVIIGEKKIELTHFPIASSFERDSKMYIGHGRGDESFKSSANGNEQDAVIYGHEHRTESTMGDEIGTIGTTTIGDTQFINLPSSGCVHGKNTSLVTISIENDKIDAKVHSVSYEREKLEEALKETHNPNARFFGGIKDDGGR